MQPPRQRDFDKGQHAQRRRQRDEQRMGNRLAKALPANRQHDAPDQQQPAGQPSARALLHRAGKAREHIAQQQQPAVLPAVGRIGKAVEHHAHRGNQQRQHDRRRGELQAAVFPAARKQRQHRQHCRRGHGHGVAPAVGGDERDGERPVGGRRIPQQALTRGHAVAAALQKAQRRGQQKRARHAHAQQIGRQRPAEGSGQPAQSVSAVQGEVPRQRVEQQHQAVHVQEIEPAQRRPRRGEDQRRRGLPLQSALRAQQHQRQMDAGIGEHGMLQRAPRHHVDREGVGCRPGQRAAPAHAMLPAEGQKRKPRQFDAQRRQQPIADIRPLGREQRRKHRQRIAQPVVVQPADEILAEAQRKIEQRRVQRVGEECAPPPADGDQEGIVLSEIVVPEHYGAAPEGEHSKQRARQDCDGRRQQRRRNPRPPPKRKAAPSRLGALKKGVQPLCHWYSLPFWSCVKKGKARRSFPFPSL